MSTEKNNLRAGTIFISPQTKPVEAKSPLPSQPEDMLKPHISYGAIEQMEVAPEKPQKKLTFKEKLAQWWFKKFGY